MEALYNKALLPILQGAHRQGAIGTIPSCSQLLETAHILPGQSGRPKPIIARFYSRNLRSIIFKFKKDHAPRTPSTTTQKSTHRLPRFSYPIYEDLTRDTFICLKALSADTRTSACWTVSGHIKYKLNNSNDIKKVSSIYSSVDSIIGN
jgi:hypothetical protein